MSTAATDRDLEMLAWLAERDMEAVAHAHARFLAATEPDDVASLGRTYQKVSRCLRSTLALKMKAAERRAERAAPPTALSSIDALARDAQVDARTVELQDAMDRIAAAAVPDPAERDVVLDSFDYILDDWSEAADYLDADLDDLVARACRLLLLPQDLAATWRTL
ncbi:MAG: hypothetical protein GC203_01390, partial [Phenylobacterium sp.]|uniref:hypothetical protein n=1 Tax=Phenylobacterium sp. TaxID=1871053 RepID=UPI0025FF9C75